MRKIKRPKIGQYVMVARWSDKDPRDPWYVGFVSEIIIRETETACKVAGSYREWKNIWSITEQEGRAWLDAHVIYSPGNGPHGRCRITLSERSYQMSADTDTAINENVERLTQAVAGSDIPLRDSAILAAILRAAAQAATELVPWLALAHLRQALQIRPEDERR